MAEKQNWIFTFGSGQTNEGKYVKIYGTWSEARNEMLIRFGTEWGFQYPEEEWEAYVTEAKDFAKKYLGGEQYAFVEKPL